MRPSVLFILSAKPCDPELQVEFGAKIPACMVPIGPNRLLNLQLEEARKYIKPERVFVAVHQEAFIPGKEVFGDQVQFCHMDSVSLEHTFSNLMREFKKWYYGFVWTPDVFVRDEWDIHFLNGDTLITDSEAWWNVGTCYTKSAADTPFEMSKEFSIYHEMQPRPEPGLEYAGKGAYTFSLAAEEKDPLHYGSYMNIVRTGEKLVLKNTTWLDFGHSATYWQSKRNVLSSRSFNRVTLDRYSGYLCKSGGGNEDKIKAEYDWYKNVPENVAMYTPHVKESSGADMRTYFSYDMEYLAFPTLAELLVYGNHDQQFWGRIAGQLISLLCRLRDGVPKDYVSYNGVFLKKTRERIANLNHPWKDHAESMIEWLEPRIKQMPAVLHGDLCFSNILYDRRSDTLKIIDPRGHDMVDGVRGNQLYDLAKLFHSAYGGYDFALANFVPDEKTIDNCLVVCDRLVKYAEGNDVKLVDLMATTGLLFYSMLPLHKDDMERVGRLVGQGNLVRMKWMELTNVEGFK